MKLYVYQAIEKLNGLILSVNNFINNGTVQFGDLTYLEHYSEYYKRDYYDKIQSVTCDTPILTLNGDFTVEELEFIVSTAKVIKTVQVEDFSISDE
ncbi:hypothetical protein Lepto7375DRAFT_7197 [Leptolyngbya sp. PCC 7375]|nr:hypothetical protein Lepto7375DRAFT_7197 [Leptolyngbya sp. PCC 7375]